MISRLHGHETLRTGAASGQDVHLRVLTREPVRRREYGRRSGGRSGVGAHVRLAPDPLDERRHSRSQCANRSGRCPRRRTSPRTDRPWLRSRIERGRPLAGRCRAWRTCLGLWSTRSGVRVPSLTLCDESGHRSHLSRDIGLTFESSAIGRALAFRCASRSWSARSGGGRALRRW